MTDHNEIKQLLSAYLDEAVTAQEKQFVEDHLIDCASCRKDLKELTLLSKTLKNWADENLSPDLEQKIQKKIMEAPMNITKVSAFRLTSSIAVAVLLFVLVQHTFKSSETALKTRIIDGTVFLKTAADDIGDQFSPGNTNHTGIRNKLDQIALDDKKLKSSQMPASTAVSKVEQLSKGLGSTTQYEPYYLSSNYKVEESSKRREVGGVQSSSYQVALKAPQDMSDSVQQRLSGYVAEPELEYWGGGGVPLNYPDADFNTEQYNYTAENQFLAAKENPLSTFSIDVDTASYSNIRRFLNSNQMPPADAVRIEEMINYFSYDYPKPEGDKPFSVTIKASTCPWNKDHQLALVGIQGKSMDVENLPPSNLVFLIDVSGSMNDPNKLSLLKSSFRLMVNQLTDKERVAIVVYAGAAGKVLDSTPGSQKQTILNAIDNLQAGGSTAGGAGIKLAYEIAKQNFIKEGNNRVILATDGDFNVGVSSDGELVRIIEEKRKEGVFLTVLGFGTGNYKDSKMEQIADKGNGNYYYIDTLNEGKKVLVSELGSTLFAIAKDVKIQIEFNPAQVKAYRLVGYENRILAKEDFNDDTKDAGELGAGHTVTALYEITPADSKDETPSVDELKYQQTKSINSDEMMTVKLRYKNPDSNTSQLIQQTVEKEDVLSEPKDDFKFAAAVAEFGLLIKHSQFKGNASYDEVLKFAQESKGKDPYNYRSEFIGLVEKAKMIDINNSGPGIMFKGN